MTTQLKVPIYKVAEPLLPDLMKRVETLDKKAQKMGGYVRLAWFETEKHYLADGSFVILQEITIDGIIGDAEGDWTPAAKLEIEPGANVVYRLPTFTEEIPVRFRTTDTSCEHCKVNRLRKNIWVFYNTETDEFVQVGSACLKEFTGDRNVSDVIKLSQIMLEVEKVVKQAVGTGVKAGDISDTALYYDLEPFLCRVVAQIKDDGRYIGRGDDPAKSTANQALYRKGDESKHLPLVKEALAWLVSTWSIIPSPNTYQMNMLTICAQLQITYKRAGYAASLMTVYFKHLEKTKATAGKPVSHHFGVVGQRYKNVSLKAVYSHSFGENQWGLQHINKFEDGDGNVFVWFTGKPVEVDSDYVLAMTVKKHDDFNGVDQTIITNCRM